MYKRQVPNLLMPQMPEVHLGKYAELRRAYLKKRRRVLYTNLKTSGALTEHGDVDTTLPVKVVIHLADTVSYTHLRWWRCPGR